MHPVREHLIRQPEDIFKALSKEIPSYGGLNYDAIGDQGIQLGSGGAEPS